MATTTRNRVSKPAPSPAPNPPDARAVRARIAGLRKEPWECLIDVYLRPPGSDPPFQLQTCLEMNTAKRVFFRNRRRPGFIIRFRLHNELNPGYRFPPDPMQAIWSHAGSACPDAAVWDIFTPLSVDGARTTLVVYNENPRPAIGNFKYTLNVINAAGVRLPLDPGGFNQNGESD